MNVLLSIKPEFALKIFDGSKKYEYRRIIFKRDNIARIIVYASAPISEVIGEFEVEEILHNEPRKLWTKTKDYAGISKEKFFDYFFNTTKAYAIKIKNSKTYDAPLSLDKLGISYPPQSFRYLNSLHNPSFEY